jgi:hypothetical protein
MRHNIFAQNQRHDIIAFTAGTASAAYGLVCLKLLDDQVYDTWPTPTEICKMHEQVGTCRLKINRSILAPYGPLP